MFDDALDRPQAQLSTAARPTVVLVHGAWHGPWCWEGVQRRLHTLGWETTAPRLRSVPATGTRPGSGLRDDVASLLEHIDHIDGPVAVVAHCYAGLPSTEVAALRPDKVTQLMYLAAYVPQRGDSVFGLHGMPVPEGPAGTVDVPDDPTDSLYAGVQRDTALAASARLRPQSLRAWTEPVEHVDTTATATTYLLCSNDQALPTRMQGGFSAHADRTVRLDCGHTPFLSRPQELAECLGHALLVPPRRARTRPCAHA